MTKTQTPELQLVSGETGHKYFHQMLNMADDDLNPHEYRLLGHYLRWAGHGGTREEGIRQTAKVCHMGQKALRKHRAALVTKGYLRLIEPTAEQLKEGEPTKIIVLDRWAENIARYAQTDTPPVSKQIQGSPEPVSKQIHPPVSKQIHKEEQEIEERLSSEEHKEKDSAPEGAQGSGFTNRQKTDLVKAWWEALPEINRPGVDPKKMYAFKGYLSAAERALDKGITPEKLAYFIKGVTYQGQFYHDKTMSFGAACSNAPAWLASHYRPPTKRLTPEELDEAIYNTTPELEEMPQWFQDGIKKMVEKMSA